MTWDGSAASHPVLHSSSDYSKAGRNANGWKDIWQRLRFWSGYSDYSKTMRNSQSCKGLGYQHNFNDYSKTRRNMNEDQGLGKRLPFSGWRAPLARTPRFRSPVILGPIHPPVVNSGPGCSASERSPRLQVFSGKKEVLTQSRKAAKKKRRKSKDSSLAPFQGDSFAASEFPASEFFARSFGGLRLGRGGGRPSKGSLRVVEKLPTGERASLQMASGGAEGGAASGGPPSCPSFRDRRRIGYTESCGATSETRDIVSRPRSEHVHHA